MLSVSQAKLVAPNVLRVTFSLMPLMTASDPYSARNRFSYALACGTQEVSAYDVKPTKADPFSVDLYLTAVPVTGTCTLTVKDVRTVYGLELSGNVVTFESLGALGSPNPGALAETAEDRVRKFLNEAMVGEEWDAFCAAVGYSDRLTEDVAAVALDQNFFLRAGGIYLERLTAGIGVERPAKTGMSDSTLGQLASDINANKLTDVAILNILKAYYGEDATRTALDAENVEPYALADGQYQLLNIDGVDVRIDFWTDDFTNIAQAKAHEIAAVINRKLLAFNTPGLAVATKLVGTTDTILRVYSGRFGQQGFVSAIGGNAQTAIKFPTRLITTIAAASTWNLSTGSAPDTARLEWTAGTDPTLATVEVGDVLNLFGTPFVADNRGVFTITAVSSTWVEFVKPYSFTEQLSVVLVGADDIVFWRPAVSRLQGYFPNVVNDGAGGSIVVLPATTAAIARSAKTAWYLHGSDFKQITSATRDANGLVTVTTPVAHGLQVDDVVNLQNWIVDPAFTAARYTDTIPWSSFVTFLDAIELDDGSIFVIASDPGINNEECWRITVTAPGVFNYDACTRPDPSDAVLRNLGPGALAKLPDGRIIILDGGTVGRFGIYDPATDVWTMSLSPALFTLGAGSYTLGSLSDGRVLAMCPQGRAAVFSLTTVQWTIVQLTDVTSAIADPTGWLSAMYITTDDRAYMVAPDAGNSANLVVCDVLAGESLQIPITWEGNNDEGEAPILSPLVFVPRGPRGTFYYTTEDSGSGLSRLVNFDIASEISYEAQSYTSDTASFPDIFPENSTFHQLADGQYLVYGGAGLLTAQTQFPKYIDLIRGPIVFSQTSLMSKNLEATPFTNAPEDYGSNIPLLFRLSDNSVLAFGGLDPGGNAWTNIVQYIFDPAVTSGVVPNDVRVTDVPSTTSFRFESVPEKSAWLSGEFAPTTSPFTYQSGYILDTEAGVTIVNQRTTLTVPVNRGPSNTLVTVADASGFPDEPGYIVFNFGFQNQVGPIRYLGSNGTNSIRLEPGQAITASQAVGATVTLLRDRGVFNPDPSKEYGVTWLTASSAGRVEAQADVEFIAAAGGKLTFEILYPGDRGLGNAGYPDTGAQKLSDRVWVWGGDTLDAELAEAREDDV